MRPVHLVVAILSCAICSLNAETYAVLKSAEIDAHFTDLQKPVALYQDNNLTVSLEVQGLVRFPHSTISIAFFSFAMERACWR